MNYTSKNTTTPQNINRLTAIGLPIRKSKFLALVIAGLFFVSGALGQTIITTGNTVNASTITAGNTVQINAGGTLNMDAANTFASITTFNAGTSTISGTFALTVTGNVSIVALNTLSLGVNISIAGALNMTGSTIQGTGTIALGGNITTNASASTATISAPIALGGIPTFTVASSTANPDLSITSVD